MYDVNVINVFITKKSLGIDAVRIVWMLLPTLYYSSETLIWFEYDKPRIKAVELYFLACTWGIRGINWVKNVVKNLCGAKNWEEHV